MAIKVACPKCKKVLAAKDEMAGRAVRCPQCQQLLKLPAAAGAKPAASRPAARPSPAAMGIAAGGAAPVTPPVRQAPVRQTTTDPLPSLFDEEYGLDTKTIAGPPCPGCGRPFPPDKVLCIECGYHRAKGKKIGPERPVLAPADTGIAPEGVKEAARKKRKASSSTADGGGSEMAGGLAMMVGAGIWLYCGVVYQQFIYYYPIYLFIAGLAAFARGLFKG